MAKTFKIDLAGDSTKLEAATRRGVAGLAQVEKARERSAAAAERQATREAAAYDRNALRAQRAADRAADAAVKAGERAAAATTRTAEREARQKQLIGDRMVARESGRMVTSERAAQRAADAAVKAKEREARQKQVIDARMGARENARLVASERANQRTADSAIRVKEREARQKQAIEDRFLKREHDRMVSAERVKGKEAGPGGLSGFMADARSLAGPVAVLGAVVLGISESFASVNARIRESTGLVTDYQESLLELASLKGKTGATAEVMAEDIGFRAKTLQRADQSKDFQLAAFGSGESSIDNDERQALISKGEWKTAMELAGGFQAAEGGSAKTHGDLLGVLPQLIGQRTTGKEVFQKEQQLVNIFRPGRGEFSSLANQYMKLTPLIKSGVYKPMQAGALLSSFSTIAGEGAGEMLQQFTRATLGSVGRQRGAPMEDMDTEKTGAYLSGLAKAKGVDLKAIGSEGIGDLIADDVSRRKAEAAAKGESFSDPVFFKSRGFGNMLDVNALMGWRGMREAYKRSFKPLAEDEAMPSLEKATAFQERFRRGRVGQRRVVELAGTAANAYLGNETMAGYDAQHEAAFIRLQSKRNFFTAGMEYKDTLGGGVWATTADARIRTEMYADLNRRRQAVGLDAVAETGGSWTTGTLSTVADRAEQFAAAEAEIGAAQGETGVAIAPLVELARRSLEFDERQVAALEKLAGGGGESWGGGGDGGASWALPESSAPRAGAMR